MAEELGDLLLQVVFHCQLANERGAFDFEKVTRHLVDKLIRRHPHVFGETKVKNVDEVWANWEKIKRAEKAGTHLERKSAFDGIPKHMPALQRAETHAPFLARAMARLPDLVALLAAGEGEAALAWAKRAGDDAPDLGAALRRERLALALALAVGECG